MADPKFILVTGATGYVGGRLVPPAVLRQPAHWQSNFYTNLVSKLTNLTSLDIRAGQYAKVVSSSDLNYQYGSEFNTGTNRWVTKVGTIIAGAATLRLYGGNCSFYCTIEVVTAGEPLVPSTAVVMPADSGVQVNTILESSTDMVNHVQVDEFAVSGGSAAAGTGSPTPEQTKP